MNTCMFLPYGVLAASLTNWGRCGFLTCEAHIIQYPRRGFKGCPYGCQIHNDQGTVSSKGFPELDGPDAVSVTLEQGTMLFECSVRAISLSCLHLMLGGRGMSGTSGGQKHVTHFLCRSPPPFAGFAKRLSACTATLSPVSPHLPQLACPCLSAEKLGDKSKMGT